MTQPNEIDDLAGEFAAVRRRIAQEVQQALRQGRAVQGNRRQLTAGLSAEQRQQVSQLVRASHAQLRAQTHPQYAQQVSRELQNRGLEDQARTQAAQAERQSEARVRDAERRTAEQEQRQAEQDQGRGGAEGFVLTAAASALVGVATQVLLSELDQLDRDADAVEAGAHQADTATEPVADMSVVEMGHPRGMDELLTAAAGTVGPSEAAPVPEVGVEAESGLEV